MHIGKATQWGESTYCPVFVYVYGWQWVGVYLFIYVVYSQHAPLPSIILHALPDH
jgi:hypothetical protein